MFFKLLATMTPYQARLCAVALWSIWKSRNQMLWEQIDTSPMLVASRAISLAEEWLNAQLPTSTTGRNPPPTDASWSKPPHGYVKTNVDAGFDHQIGKVGLGWVIRNEAGEFLVARSSQVQGALQPSEGEALGLLHAIKWVCTLGFTHVVFETDCKVVANRISHPKLDHTELGFIIQECKNLLSTHPNFYVVFTSKKANM